VSWISYRHSFYYSIWHSLSICWYHLVRKRFEALRRESLASSTGSFVSLEQLEESRFPEMNTLLKSLCPSSDSERSCNRCPECSSCKGYGMRGDEKRLLTFMKAFQDLTFEEKGSRSEWVTIKSEVEILKTLELLLTFRTFVFFLRCLEKIRPRCRQRKKWRRWRTAVYTLIGWKFDLKVYECDLWCAAYPELTKPQLLTTLFDLRKGDCDSWTWTAPNLPHFLSSS